MKSGKSSMPKDNLVRRIGSSVYPAFAMLAAMQLDLFTPLKDGPLSAEQIAEAIGVGSAKLRPLLYALVVAELLTLEGDAIFANTEAANCFLVRGGSSCMLGSQQLYSELWHNLLETAESIRTGVPQAKHDYSAMPSNHLDEFIRSMHPEALEYGRDLVARFDLSSCCTLLDVGGGSGGLAIAVTEACPHIRATIVDLPTVTPITQRVVQEAGAGDRIQVLSVDVVSEALPGSYDVAVLSAFLQVLSPDDACRSLKNISRVINPGGRIYIRGLGIIDDCRTSPPELAGLNLVFINVYDEGQAYTEQEHKDWLAEAGFVSFKRKTLPDGNSWISAKKPELSS